jgi:hypothetical protein
MNNNNLDQNIFDWKLFQETEKFIQKQIARILIKNPKINNIAKRITHDTSTLFTDWIDHITLSEKSFTPEILIQLGFKEFGIVDKGEKTVFKNIESIFPPILLSRLHEGLAIRVNDIECFNKEFGIKNNILGEAFGPLRIQIMYEDQSYLFKVVQRRGYNGFNVSESTDREHYLNALKELHSRPREYSDIKTGYKDLKKIISNNLRNLKKGRLTDAFLRAEKSYWINKNKVGQSQLKRQARYGLGWENVDHYTYRSSRTNFF